MKTENDIFHDENKGEVLFCKAILTKRVGMESLSSGRQMVWERQRSKALCIGLESLKVQTVLLIQISQGFSFNSLVLEYVCFLHKKR